MLGVGVVGSLIGMRMGVTHPPSMTLNKKTVVVILRVRMENGPSFNPFDPAWIGGFNFNLVMAGCWFRMDRMDNLLWGSLENLYWGICMGANPNNTKITVTANVVADMRCENVRKY